MTEAEASGLVGMLMAAFPQMTFTGDTIRVYVRSLRDLTASEARQAVEEVLATARFFPTIAEVRDVAMERRLELPRPEDAWEQVLAHAQHRSKRGPCVRCAGFGSESGSDDVPCAECRGTGESTVADRPPLDESTRRALDFVGGAWAVRTTDRPEVLRAQFLKAHDHFRRAELRTANLAGLGVLEPAARRLALTEAGTPS